MESVFYSVSCEQKAGSTTEAGSYMLHPFATGDHEQVKTCANKHWGAR